MGNDVIEIQTTAIGNPSSTLMTHPNYYQCNVARVYASVSSMNLGTMNALTIDHNVFRIVLNGLKSILFLHQATINQTIDGIIW